MASKKNKMFLVNFNDGSYDFVYAKNLNDAKDKMLEKHKEQVYNQINWSSVVSGDDAEDLESVYRNLTLTNRRKS